MNSLVPLALGDHEPIEMPIRLSWNPAEMTVQIDVDRSCLVQDEATAHRVHAVIAAAVEGTLYGGRLDPVFWRIRESLRPYGIEAVWLR